MKLIRIIYFLTSLFFIFFSYSCNDHTDNYVSLNPSADSQIYGFSLKAIPISKADTANYAVLGKTQFVIDQIRQVIYNPDSLPFNTHLKKFAATVTFSDATPSKLEIIYEVNNNDSVVNWNGTDSIDFSKNNVSLKVTPSNGLTASSSTYRIQLRVHRINPDMLVWKHVTSLSNAQPDNGEKIILQDGVFYRFYLSDGNVNLQTAKKGDITPLWDNTLTTNLPNNTSIKNIVFFGNNFYAITQTGLSYFSADGKSWLSINNNTNIQQIIGVIPEVSTAGKNGSLLLVLNDGADYFLACSKDLNSFDKKTKIESSALYDYETFLELIKTDFFSWTRYDNVNPNSNYLSFIAVDGRNKKLWSWLFASIGSDIIVTKNCEKYDPFNNKADLTSSFIFRYDDKYNALNNDSLYLSKDGAKSWSKSPKGLSLDSGIKTKYVRSVIVDEDNFIWVFTRNDPSTYGVWKGRLNRLIK